MNNIFKNEYLEKGLFTKKDIKKLLIPLVAELILAYLVGLADSVMVASAGEAAVSAVSLVDSLSLLMINLFTGLAAGGAVVAGQYLGRKDEKNSKDSANHLMLILLILSVVITVLMQVFRTNILNMLFSKAAYDVRQNCDIYYRIVIMSVPFIALFNGGAALFRMTGNSRIPMMVSVLMNIINIIGNAVLIYGFGMGVSGVAIPTLISRGVAMLVTLILLMKPDFVLTMSGIVHLKINMNMVKNILSYGIPNSIENGMFQFGKLLLMSLVSTLPTASITANAIGNTVGNLHCVIGMAFNSGLIAIASHCAGAGDYKQDRFYTRYMIVMTYIYEGIVCIIMVAAIPFINSIYGISGNTALMASRIMALHGITTIFFWPISFMLNTSMRAAGDAKFSMVVSVASMWIFRVALSYILIAGFKCGVLSIWVAWVFDWLFRVCFFIPRWIGNKWETKAVK